MSPRARCACPQLASGRRAAAIPHGGGLGGLAPRRHDLLAGVRTRCRARSLRCTIRGCDREDRCLTSLLPRRLAPTSRLRALRVPSSLPARSRWSVVAFARRVCLLGCQSKAAAKIDALLSACRRGHGEVQRRVRKRHLRRRQTPCEDSPIPASRSRRHSYRHVPAQLKLAFAMPREARSRTRRLHAGNVPAPRCRLCDRRRHVRRRTRSRCLAQRPVRTSCAARDARPRRRHLLRRRARAGARLPGVHVPVARGPHPGVPLPLRRLDPADGGPLSRPAAGRSPAVAARPAAGTRACGRPRHPRHRPPAGSAPPSTIASRVGSTSQVHFERSPPPSRRNPTAPRCIWRTSKADVGRFHGLRAARADVEHEHHVVVGHRWGGLLTKMTAIDLPAAISRTISFSLKRRRPGVVLIDPDTAPAALGQPEAAATGRGLGGASRWDLLAQWRASTVLGVPSLVSCSLDRRRRRQRKRRHRGEA